MPGGLDRLRYDDGPDDQSHADENGLSGGGHAANLVGAARPAATASHATVIVVDGTIEPGYGGVNGHTGPFPHDTYLGTAYAGATGATRPTRATGASGAMGHHGFTGTGHIGPTGTPYVFAPDVTGATGPGTASIGSAYQYPPEFRLGDAWHEHAIVTYIGAAPGHTTVSPVHQPTIGAVGEGALAFAATAGAMATVSATTWPSIRRVWASIRRRAAAWVRRVIP